MSPLDVLFGTGASGADLSGTSSTVMLTSGVTTTASGDLQAVTAVGQVRLPRVLVCMVVGAALSVAGAAYQGMFQNPMASQDVLGASSGAAFGAALGLFLGVGALFTSVFAFGFGLLAVFVSYAISRMSRSNRILSMVLAGMVISSLFSSGTSFLKLVADTESILPAITYWLMGSLSSVRASDVAPVFLLVALALVPLYLVRWRINLLATGEEEALAMGLNAGRLRILVIVCATFLTATCISVCGLIGWVGLVIPHFCRLIFGSDYRRVIPACILAGAAFLLIVDDCSRLFTTSEIPIGILTSFVGAPVFIWLIARGGGAREKR
jgi:iron complex transport system permease protein